MCHDTLFQRFTRQFKPLAAVETLLWSSLLSVFKINKKLQGRLVWWCILKAGFLLVIHFIVLHACGYNKYACKW